MLSSLVIRILMATLLFGLISCGSLPTNNSDRRNPETQLVDEAIELRVFNRLISSTNNNGRVNAVSYGRRVLLLGEVPTAEDKVMAERVAASVDNVQRVISELKVMPNASADQRSQDALINTRIQTALIAANDLASNAFIIKTNQSTVYIMGVVTQREAERAIGIARTTSGVKQVVNMVDLISEATLASLQTSGPRAAPTATIAPPVSNPTVAIAPRQEEPQPTCAERWTNDCAIQQAIAHVATTVSAQSNLPACSGSDVSRWSNCYGTYIRPGGGGRKYVGEFRNGKATGQGTLTMSNGGIFSGEWKDDKLNGRGTITWPGGGKFVGEFRDDNINGQGAHTFANGNKYVGEYRDDKRTGQGIYTFADGSPTQEGIWENDKFVRAERIPDHIAGRTSTATQAVAQVTSPLVRGPSDSYGGRVAARIRPNVVLADPVVGNPRAEVEVRADAEGKILRRRLVTSSGNYAWDQAVLRAIDRTGTLPRDTDGRVPSVLIIGLRPEGAIPDAVDSIQNSEQIAGRTSLSAPAAAQVVPSTAQAEPPVAQAPRQAEPPRATPSLTPTTGRPNERRSPAESFFSKMAANEICSWLNSGVVHSGGDIQSALDELELRAETCRHNSFSPPTVAQAPRQAEPPRSTLSLSASASQPDANGVVTLAITTNSDTASLRVNGDEAGGRADGRYSVQRFAQVGTTNFEVIATDRFGNTRRQTISVSRQAADNTVRFASLNPIAVRARPANNAVAIIIGIQDYRRVSKAEFANNDARVFYDYAIRGLGVRPENIKLLVDQEADQVEVLSAFKNWLPLKTRKGLTDVYVFYSGHGLPSDDGSNLYMLPHGVDRQFLNETAIKQSVLIAALQAASPRSVTMFMDACYSGQSRTGETLLASARPISIQSKASSYPANFNVISASAPDQLASSSPDLKHGVFSYFLMKGMEGEADENKDGNITMAEMQSYLKEYVGKKAMSLNRTQVPQLTGDQSRVLVSR